MAIQYFQQKRNTKENNKWIMENKKQIYQHAKSDVNNANNMDGCEKLNITYFRERGYINSRPEQQSFR